MSTFEEYEVLYDWEAEVSDCVLSVFLQILSTKCREPLTRPLKILVCSLENSFKCWKKMNMVGGWVSLNVGVL
jgi:hypothetical protein